MLSSRGLDTIVGRLGNDRAKRLGIGGVTESPYVLYFLLRQFEGLRDVNIGGEGFETWWLGRFGSRNSGLDQRMGRWRRRGEGGRVFWRDRIRTEGSLSFILNLILVDRFQFINVLQTFPVFVFSRRLLTMSLSAYCMAFCCSFDLYFSVTLSGSRCVTRKRTSCTWAHRRWVHLKYGEAVLAKAWRRAGRRNDAIEP